MPEADFLIKNCTADDFAYACPKIWSELKPSLTAAVRQCKHCNRRVYLCKADADIKLSTSVNDCIAIADTRTQSEKEWDARFRATVTPAGDAVEPAQRVRMIGVMLLPGSERTTVLRLVSGGMRTDEIPDFLHKQPLDIRDNHGGHENQ